MNLHPRHIKELEASTIDPTLAALNCQSLSGDEIYPLFFRATDINQVSQRTRKDAQWRYIRRRWRHLEHGALVFTGLDPDINCTPFNCWRLETLSDLPPPPQTPVSKPPRQQIQKPQI